MVTGQLAAYILILCILILCKRAAVCTHYALFVLCVTAIKSSDTVMMSHEQVLVAVDTRRNAAVESALVVASKLIARGCPSQLAAYMQGMHLILLLTQHSCTKYTDANLHCNKLCTQSEIYR